MKISVCSMKMDVLQHLRISIKTNLKMTKPWNLKTGLQISENFHTSDECNIIASHKDQDYHACLISEEIG